MYVVWSVMIYVRAMSDSDVASLHAYGTAHRLRTFIHEPASWSTSSVPSLHFLRAELAIQRFEPTRLAPRMRCQAQIMLTSV